MVGPASADSRVLPGSVTHLEGAVGVLRENAGGLVEVMRPAAARLEEPEAAAGELDNGGPSGAVIDRDSEPSAADDAGCDEAGRSALIKGRHRGDNGLKLFVARDQLARGSRRCLRARGAARGEQRCCNREQASLAS